MIFRGNEWIEHTDNSQELLWLLATCHRLMRGEDVLHSKTASLCRKISDISLSCPLQKVQKVGLNMGTLFSWLNLPPWSLVERVQDNCVSFGRTPVCQIKELLHLGGGGEWWGQTKRWFKKVNSETDLKVQRAKHVKTSYAGAFSELQQNHGSIMEYCTVCLQFSVWTTFQCIHSFPRVPEKLVCEDLRRSSIRTKAQKPVTLSYLLNLALFSNSRFSLGFLVLFPFFFFGLFFILLCITVLSTKCKAIILVAVSALHLS